MLRKFAKCSLFIVGVYMSGFLITAAVPRTEPPAEAHENPLPKPPSVVVMETQEPEFKVEVTYYSHEEPTNIKGYEAKNCRGGDLKPGDYAAPDFIPLDSILEITFEDGRTDIAHIVDRGNTNIIKVFDRKDKKGDITMRLDKYVDNVEGYGRDIATVRIIRWGRD